MITQKEMKQTAMEIVDGLYHHIGQNAVICGGFARDSFYGLESKDVDIMLLDPKWVNPCKVEESLRFIARHLDKYALVQRHQGEEYMDDRIEAVWQVVIKGLNCDVLWYNPQRYNMATGEEACEAFDFNINQFYLDENGVPTFGGEAYDHPSNVKSLVQLEAVSNERLSRMAVKWDLIKDKI